MFLITWGTLSASEDDSPEESSTKTDFHGRFPAHMGSPSPSRLGAGGGSNFPCSFQCLVLVSNACSAVQNWLPEEAAAAREAPPNA